MSALPEAKVRYAILFADISGSTQLYVQLGDAAAQTIIARALDVLAEASREHQGTVIKTIGDEIMCRFPAPDHGFDAAVAMQQRLRAEAGRISDQVRVGIRVGMHWGEAVMQAGDVFGDAVNVAARVASVAGRDQIVITEQSLAGLTGPRAGRARACDRVALKGRVGEVVLYAVDWDADA